MYVPFALRRVLIACALLLPLLTARAGDPPADDRRYSFTDRIRVRATSVKDQGRTGTCWSFATTSFIESELMRMGRDSLDLSEMFVVRETYPRKAQNYVRRNGTTQFSDGSVAGDALFVARTWGLVPETAYAGYIPGMTRHNHAELQAGLKGFLDGVLKSGASTVTTAWYPAFESILDAYLGSTPAQFEYKGTAYTPQSFRQSLGFDPDTYVELTSFTHHPFGTSFAIEIPDNWAGNTAFNVPLDDLGRTVENALASGYSVLWDADVSEQTFCHSKGVAVLPQKAWEDKTEEERARTCTGPEPEQQVTQESRQAGYESHATTDDHLMHIVGLATDAQGNRFYRVKNSWGETGPYAGYDYISEPYFRAKTISIVVNRAALPADVAGRMK